VDQLSRTAGRCIGGKQPGQITRQARDALASAAEAGATLPPAVEDAGIPPYDLSGFRDPLVMMVSYDRGDK
jgi:hypothetical protein